MHGDVSFLELGSTDADTPESQLFSKRFSGGVSIPCLKAAAGPNLPVSESGCMATTLDRRYTYSSGFPTWSKHWHSFDRPAAKRTR